LKKTGYRDIRFIPRSKTRGQKTPDLEGVSGLNRVICEVKTINPSEDEVLRRSNGNSLHNAPLGQCFLHKLMSTVATAKKQIEDFDSDNKAKHIIYVVLNFDDSWNEYNRKERDFQQIDQHLCKNPVSGIEIVLHNQKAPFYSHITMKYATVVNDE
jgi:hypothetical protein